MGEACSTNETCVKFCFSDNLNVRHLSEDLDIDVREILYGSVDWREQWRAAVNS